MNRYRKASDIIENSDLDYTIIRPGWLTDKMKMYMRSQQRTKHLKVLKYHVKCSIFSSTNCQNPELHSKENIGVNKPNTEGNKPAWFN